MVCFLRWFAVLLAFSFAAGTAGAQDKPGGDGLLLIVAKNDRTVRISPAKTLEGLENDLF